MACLVNALLIIHLPVEGVVLAGIVLGLELLVFAVAVTDAARAARRAPRRERAWWRGALVVLGSLALVMAADYGVALVFAGRTFGVYTVPTLSMAPAILDGDHILVDHLAYRGPLGGEPRRGDLVIYKYPRDRRRTFVKRVVGVPGDRLEGRDNTILLNGRALVEPFIVQQGGPDFGPVVVPEVSYFLLGDNRRHSSDSRMSEHGFVPREDVLGRVVRVLWSSDEGGFRWDRLGIRPQ